MFWKRLTLSIVGLLVAGSAAYGLPPKLTLVQGTSTPPCGVTVRILVDPMGATADVSQFTVRYKSSCLTFNSASLGANAPASSGIDWNEPAATPEFPICGSPACASCGTDFDRHVVVIVLPPSGGSYNGTGDKEIAILNFTGAAAGSACKVEWDQSSPPGLKPTFIHLSTGDVWGSSLTFVPNASPPTCPGLTINVPTQTLSGLIRYYFPLPQPNSNWLPNISVCVAPPGPPTGCSSSNASGSYAVTSVSPGAATVTPTRATDPADPNAIGGGDLNLLIRFLAGAATLTPDQQTAADVDLSGLPPNSADLQKLRRYIVFDFPTCPSCATWKFICDPFGTPSDAPCPITMAACANKTLDLKGILRGDVDGSWPNRYKPTGPSAIALAFGAARWNGSEFTVPVVAGGRDLGITSLIFSLTYDSQSIEYVAADPGQQTQAFDLTVNPATPGILHGLMTAGIRAAAGQGEILNLRFRMRHADAAGHITFSRLLINDREPERIPAIEVSPGDQAEVLPKHFQMSANPNPFNPVTRVEYSIPAGSGTVPVSLRVVDLSGRVVRDLVQAQQGPGRYRSIWDGTSGDGEPMASGVYLLQLRAGSMAKTQKAVLLK